MALSWSPHQNFVLSPRYIKEEHDLGSPVSYMKYQKKIKTDRYPACGAFLPAVIREGKGDQWALRAGSIQGGLGFSLLHQKIRNLGVLFIKYYLSKISSHLSSYLKSGLSQHTQWYIPVSLLFKYIPLKGWKSRSKEHHHTQAIKQTNPRGRLRVCWPSTKVFAQLARGLKLNRHHWKKK